MITADLGDDEVAVRLEQKGISQDTIRQMVARRHEPDLARLIDDLLHDREWDG